MFSLIPRKDTQRLQRTEDAGVATQKEPGPCENAESAYQAVQKLMSGKNKLPFYVSHKI